MLAMRGSRIWSTKSSVIWMLILSFDAEYFELILSKFREDTSLGVAGTVFEEDGYSSERQSFEGHNHVAGGARCFESAALRRSADSRQTGLGESIGWLLQPPA